MCNTAFQLLGYQSLVGSRKQGSHQDTLSTKQSHLGGKCSQDWPWTSSWETAPKPREYPAWQEYVCSPGGLGSHQIVCASSVMYGRGCGP